MNFKGKGGDYEKPELGSFAAICYKIIDLGTQDVLWQGQKKRQHKILVSWELSQKMKDGRPFSVSRAYTVSLHEKAGLRKDLEAWRGKKFTTEELDMFNEKKILGRPCLLTLVSSADGQYVNIGNVTALPSAMPAPAQVNPSTFLSLEKEEFNQAVFDALSDKLKAKIMLSPEWRELKGIKEEPEHDDIPGDAQDDGF
jgi:hypothetical protein